MSCSVGHRLREARTAAGYRTAKEFADRHGIPQPTYAMHELGKRGLKQERAIEYANLLGVSIEWLLTGAGAGPSDSAATGVGNTSSGPDITQFLPLISWVRAGEWAEVEDPYEFGQYEKLIPVTRHYSDRAYALRIEGDSMQAPEGDSFPTGSIICVEPQHQAKHGSYVVIRIDSSNEATFKQLVLDGDRQYLKPLNPRYPILEVTEDASICGVVRQLVMDFDN